MCAIGRALMASPSMVLLDEPSMGLAPQIVEEVFEIVKDLNPERAASPSCWPSRTPTWR
jgi:branched-chain amino acid transport system ATP-binding protein